MRVQAVYLSIWLCWVYLKLGDNNIHASTYSQCSDSAVGACTLQSQGCMPAAAVHTLMFAMLVDADDVSRQQGVRALPSISNRDLFYVNLIVVNYLTSHRMRAVIDPGLNVDLVIPKHLALPLNLREHRRYGVTGFGEGVTNMIEYFTAQLSIPVTVQIPCSDGAERTFKEACLSIMAQDDAKYEDVSNFSTFTKTLSAQGNLQLDPNRPPQHCRKLAVLGARGLHKLGLRLNPAGPELCPC
jgi:hypothetical protein